MEKKNIQRIDGTDYNIDAVLKMSKAEFLKQHPHAFNAEKSFDKIHSDAKKGGGGSGSADKVSTQG